MSSNQIVLVTGASRGLGRSAARHIAAAGHTVVGTYRSNRTEADALLAELAEAGRPGAVLPLDVADSASFPAFADALRATLADLGAETIDALVNNAGIGISAPYAETTEAQFDELVAVHLKAPFFLTQTLLPLLADGARVLNVSSGLARFSLPGYAAYGSVKGAVEVLTRYQAAELGARGIRVNVVAPGAIATDFDGGAVRDLEHVNTAVAGMIALGRVGEPDDIGAGVAAILSDGFGWADGARIELSGGQRL